MTAPRKPAVSKPAPPTYYLALGDSLSVGVQPDAAGTSLETKAGYADQIYAALRPGHPTLRLVKLGCPGETTDTMIGGGICHYQGGSQLAAAVAFLHAHRGRVSLITLDIGANDPEQCGSQPDLARLATCARDFPHATANLTTIVSRIKTAAPGVRILAMNYYLPALAEWRNGLSGHVVAWLAEKVAVTYNNTLDKVYSRAGIKVANVFGAFDTTNFAGQAGGLPRNVALVCRWTWECAAAPRGPNQHANPAGYQVIARTFLQIMGPNGLGSSPPAGLR
ncbi:MAG: SGNH/GDSL hydrolase family protein [Streptosporangiaceae bacterium]